MKFITAFLITALLAFVIGLFTSLPWYLFALTSFLVAMAIPQKPGKAFFTAFLALFLLWVVLALLKDIPNQHILSVKVAQILPLKGSFVALLILTGFVGGLIAGFAALAGSYVRKSK
ncbi:MAG: hypothetical protein ACOVNR_03345 [Chitinophagaceae bacterium]